MTPPKNYDPPYQPPNGTSQARKDVKSRAGFMNDTLMKSAWIGYWDERGGEDPAGPWANKFPGMPSSYKLLVETRYNSIEPADVPPFQQKTNGVWRKQYASNSPDSSTPTLISIPARSDTSVKTRRSRNYSLALIIQAWAYRFRARDGEEEKDVFALFAKEKKTNVIKHGAYEKYTYLMRDEKSYSEDYFLCIRKPKDTSKKLRRNASAHSEPNTGERSFPSPRSDDIDLDEGLDGHIAHPPSGETDQRPSPTQSTQRPTIFDYRRQTYYADFPRTHKPAQWERSETARPDIPSSLPDAEQLHQAAAVLAAITKRNTVNETGPEATPEPAARSRKSFPNMIPARASNTPATEAPERTKPSQPSAVAGVDASSEPRAAPKRPIDQESRAAHDNEGVPPPKAPKLQRCTISGANAAPVNLQMWQERKGYRKPYVDLGDEESEADADAASGPAIPNADQVVEEERLRRDEQQIRHGGPRQSPEREASHEASLPIRQPVERASAAAAAGGPPPPPQTAHAHRRVLLDIYVDGGSSDAYAMDMARCGTVQELFAKVSEEVRDELGSDGQGGRKRIRSMKFCLDLISEAHLHPRRVVRDNAAGYDVLRMKIEELWTKRPEMKELLIEVLVQVEQYQ
ncbi:hypothetical protein B0J12DRAFT_697328 [Macrophomina phaseolina]|uniref:Uncharacterized protein n=1 Tax=Macrophomina phaseolina TaxID=35725 RepID=A0ABQ8GGC4_9PEZI|nr:hypothetical protein B0J12DRAFT_697328 [Macrophomina phaseolina]